MDDSEYIKGLQEELIANFQMDFYRRTGMNVLCIVDQDHPEYTNQKRPRLTLDELARCAKLTNENINLFLPDRSRETVNLRNAFYYIAFHNEHYSKCTIGDYMGVHHTTVLHALRKAQDMFDTYDMPFADAYHRLLNNVTTYYANRYYENQPVGSDTESGVLLELC